MNSYRYRNAASEEDMKDAITERPIDASDIANMARDDNGTEQDHAECEMIWTQTNQ